MHYLAQVTQSTPDFSQLQPYVTALSGTLGLVFLAFFLFTLLVNFMIFKRTGMNPWLSLLMLVPIANFIMLLILAFTEWPVQRALRMCRAQPGGGPTYPPPPPPPPQTYNTTLPPPPSPPTPLP
jgi:apolipoprotein N-acyltransferase